MPDEDAAGSQRVVGGQRVRPRRGEVVLAIDEREVHRRQAPEVVGPRIGVDEHRLVGGAEVVDELCELVAGAGER